jgi:metal-sulfur cluster biosynthetic enzyme
MTTMAEIVEALARIPDPCSIAMRAPVDIWHLGLVEDVQIEDGHIAVTLVLTDPSCVHFGGIRNFITDALSALPGVTGVSVTMSTTALWTPDRVGAPAVRG